MYFLYASNLGVFPNPTGSSVVEGKKVRIMHQRGEIFKNGRVLRPKAYIKVAGIGLSYEGRCKGRRVPEAKCYGVGGDLKEWYEGAFPIRFLSWLERCQGGDVKYSKDISKIGRVFK